MEDISNILMSYLHVTQHMAQQFRAHFGRLNLTFPQALVLNVLGECGPVPISVLAERTGSANSTISGIVDRLEKLGLAKRERSEQDRRVIYVSATEQYQLLRTQTATDVSGYFNSILDTLGEADKALIAEALRKLEAALEARRAADAAP
ncbi:MarR family transcriptional regulator [Pseudoflavonifractor phocaeensis]|uniref:MarR family winged helix-turn-helix transcriptional regulator n=1 Tax=Pseudoflavonifractor phocaeensis TaxID=1870988 RepID=UPI00195E5DB3|nr:MarR family transcriptional regulator [Pseudoflavonifractor phocaeensis]MBM6870057.1 MarR family transcriptional regulator [Pseudoflavonifractor phocaeensis]MBM6939414.1 MarR family transcriptional regulator [Pseudoflavonifractor phocaeensis]